MHCVKLVRQSHAFLNFFFEKAFPKQAKHLPLSYPINCWVGGTHHLVLGAIEIDIKFGTLELKYPFYIIEDLHHSVILGHDFMETHNITFNIKGKRCTYWTILSM